MCRSGSTTSNLTEGSYLGGGGGKIQGGRALLTHNGSKKNWTSRRIYVKIRWKTKIGRHLEFGGFN